MYWSTNTHTHSCKHVFWAVVNVKTGVNVGNAAASVHKVFALCWGDAIVVVVVVVFFDSCAQPCLCCFNCVVDSAVVVVIVAVTVQ